MSPTIGSTPVEVVKEGGQEEEEEEEMQPRRQPLSGNRNDTYKEYRYSRVPTNPPNDQTSESTVQIDYTREPVKLVFEEDGCKDTNSVRVGALDYNRIQEEITMAEGGSKLLQFVAATAANLCILASGAMMGWTSPITSVLEQKDPVSPDNPIGTPITSEDSSWIGSLMTIGAVCGSFMAGWMSERFGRKKSLLFSAIPYMIGWALIATSTSLIQFYIARFIFGIALSIDFTIVPMYCGEIAETSIRGVLGSFLQLFVTVGLLYAYGIGPFVNYTIFWMLCGALPIAFFICFMFMPESPYYLLTQGKKTEAQESLAKLRGKSTAGIQSELNEMQAAVDQAYSTEVKLSDLWTVKANFKALLFTCAGVSFQQLTGINVVLFYAQNIFKSAGTSIDPAICTIIIGTVQLGASCVTPIVVDRLGRRILLIASGIGTAVATGTLGYYFYMKDYEKAANIQDLGWLPIASLVLFMCLYCVGWGPLPWAIMGEMFSAEVKAKASGITVFVCWALAFIITKFFTNVVDAYGTYTAFWIFTVCCVISVVFTIMILPETKGKSLQEIQDELNGVKSLQSDHEKGTHK